MNKEMSAGYVKDLCAAVILALRFNWEAPAIARKFSWEEHDVLQFLTCARKLFKRDRCRD